MPLLRGLVCNPKQFVLIYHPGMPVSPKSPFWPLSLPFASILLQIQNLPPARRSDAFLEIDGEWIEEANMGWFGMHDESTEDKDFAKKFMKFIKEANDNDTLCIIDCHI